MKTQLGAALALLWMCAAPAAETLGSAPAITESAVRAHMTFLAGDALNGRGSGSRDEWIAATYVAAQFGRLALEPMGDAGGYVQSIEVSRMEVQGAPTLAVGSGRWIHGDQMLVLALSRGKLTGPLQKYKPRKAVRAGAVLLLPRDAGELAPAILAGAAIVLRRETPEIRSSWVAYAGRQLAIGKPRLGALAPGAATASPVQIVLSAAAYAAVAALADGTQFTFVADSKPVVTHTWNTVGRLTGSDPALRDEVILLTAHLDHLGVVTGSADADSIYNGADDDASGTTAVLTLAEALASGERPKRTFIFACFGSEERGGYGSDYFVVVPVVPLEKIIANLEFEMIGRADAAVAPHTLWLTGWERTTLGPELAKHGARLVADPHPQENFFERSDNITLARRGVIAQTVSSFGLHGDYHRPSDDLGHIDFGHMTEAIESMLAPIRWLGDSALRPQWVGEGRPK
jgi:aminopeptidase YwaD